MKQKKIIIGTRGSQLSLTQTNIVKDLLQPLVPDTVIEIITIKTSGDKNMSPIPLDTIGKGWFTKEIDKQLLSGTIDLAVHSLKDLLDTLTPGLAITAIPPREDAREALVSRGNLLLKDMRKGAIIGTDSVRRKIELLKRRPDIIVKSVRGNVNRRLEKLDNGEYDGLLLAVAGLKRLCLESRIAQYFDAKDFIPSPGQGALAIVSTEQNIELNNILSQLNHSTSVIAITAEREFSKATGGGCSMPVGAYAESNGEILTLYGMLGSEDEKNVVKDSMNGDVTDPKGLAQKLAQKLLQQAASWYHSSNSNTTNESQKYIVLTRTAEENKTFAAKLESLGLHTFYCPSIALTKNLSAKEIQKYFLDISSYDWIIFTSSNGVRFFMQGLEEIEKNISLLKNIRIAAVGEKTAETAKSYGLSISFIPATFTSKALAKEIPDMKDKKILLPRSNIGKPELVTQLKSKGAIVTDMPIYKTMYQKEETTELKSLLNKNLLLCVTFTSPSTIVGFMQNFPAKKDQQRMLSIPVVSIGPVTTKAAKDHGFTKVFTAETAAVEGMVKKVKENLV